VEGHAVHRKNRAASDRGTIEGPNCARGQLCANATAEGRGPILLHQVGKLLVRRTAPATAVIPAQAESTAIAQVATYLARASAALELLQLEPRIAGNLQPLIEPSLALGLFTRAGIRVDETMMSPVIDVGRRLPWVVLRLEGWSKSGGEDEREEGRGDRRSDPGGERKGTEHSSQSPITR
jgi:hypothetical protein